MYARASHSSETFPSYEISDIDGDFGSEDFYAGEPVAPLHLRGPTVVPYSHLFLLIACAVGWGFASDSDVRQRWASTLEEIVAAANNAAQPTSPPKPLPTKDVASIETPAPSPAPTALPPPAPPAAAIAQPLPEVTVTNAPGDKSDSDSTKSAATSATSDAYSPPPPSTDPYRKRAEAVGLHPDLSRAVLARLTAADYRNAAFAIRKAITTVPDDGDFTWPRSKKTGTAVFNVHFVQGAGHDCRRYVVTVTKDRWTTTALPMEKCGVKVAYRSAAKEKTIE